MSQQAISENKNNSIQWQPLIEMIIVLVTILGSTIPLYIHTDSKMDKINERMDATLHGIREDMRDFHARLERQDAEFKGKMEKQDAEFKAHLMYHHDMERK